MIIVNNKIAYIKRLASAGRFFIYILLIILIFLILDANIQLKSNDNKAMKEIKLCTI